MNKALSEILLFAEDKNFKKWLQEEIMQELVPIWNREQYLNEPQFHAEVKLNACNMFKYELEGLSKLQKFIRIKSNEESPTAL